MSHQVGRGEQKESTGSIGSRQGGGEEAGRSKRERSPRGQGISDHISDQRARSSAQQKGGVPAHPVGRSPALKANRGGPVAQPAVLERSEQARPQELQTLADLEDSDSLPSVVTAIHVQVLIHCLRLGWGNLSQ